MAGRSERRAGGRTARHVARETRDLTVACRPGQIGGAYRPLSDPEIKTICDTALRVLAEVGMGEVPEVLREQAMAAGAEVSEAGRLTYSRSLVEDVLDSATKSFVFHGQLPDHDFEVGGDRVYYGTGGAAVKTLDLESGQYRPAELRDLYDFARVADTLDNVSWFTRCSVATDVADLFDFDLNTAYACALGTAKPIGTSFAIGAHVDAAVEMFDMVLGGTGRFRQRPFCKAHISPVVSPLKYGEDAVDVAIACVRNGMPISAIIASQSGATAPATLAGALVQSTAETIAGLLMVNFFGRGHPTIFGNWPFVVDLRTGSFSGSGGEISVLNAAAAQIGRWLGLPTGVSACMADAKPPDAQMGAEKGVSSLATGLAGGNLIYECSGMMASLLGASFEAFILDNEMLSHVQRVIRGIEVNEETLAFETIRDAVDGAGHYLGGDHTLAAMERDYFFPTLADRADITDWEERGAPNIWDTARDRARDILANHWPAHIPTEMDATVRERFNILVPPRVSAHQRP